MAWWVDSLFLKPNGKFYLAFGKGWNTGAGCRFNEDINMNVCRRSVYEEDWGEMRILRVRNERSPDRWWAVWRACRKVKKTSKLMLTPWGPTLFEEETIRHPEKVIAWRDKKKELTWRDQEGNSYRRSVTTFSTASCEMDWSPATLPSIGGGGGVPNLSLADPIHPDEVPLIHER